MKDMISLEEARALVCGAVAPTDVEEVGLLDAVGRVAASDLTSDIDVSPFAHSAMDGFALRAADIGTATEEAPVALRVIAEIGAGDVFAGVIGAGECVRIMTGACLPDDADAVVKYEIVAVVEGDGRTGSTVSFAAPTKVGSNIRPAGEEARAGEVIVAAGEVISAAGVGFLAGCGVLEVPVCRRPRVAVIATGSELVPPTEVPGPGKIRNSNSYAMAACASRAGAVPHILPIVEDTYEALRAAVDAASREYDFVVTTGGAANGDYDFIKPVVADLGELKMATVNMRPGKAQTFGLVNGTPVFGLPGNPAAAYVGFELIIRPALRTMQGYGFLDHPVVRARLTQNEKNRDPRRIFLRGTLTRAADGVFEVTPARNQSSGLFGPIQKTNCMAVLPDGTEPQPAGTMVDCILLDVPEEVCL
ncbi:molybdopterin molybdenumtransferase MoeA [Enterorhabdus mucosicola]|uniref:Molybdopterin molybdenumtransferase n=1 Tax=Adlercreutzia mucosicola TaxID=580026 RepID=A0A6N8JKT9_9ACTN|nr:gephyrin-like molybdotransferase Glp [Adlercreutzia mucosicola]MVX60468.1 molybdopterin molybdenumtransferase MoeA [Adlercreutzia mucosicola]